MKKTINILVHCAFALMISCNKDKVNMTILDFSKTEEIILEPYKFKPYAMFKLRVKGYSNDTIRINYNLYGNTNFLLCGKVDKLLVSTDYYGEGLVKLIFDPYKATKGSIEIDADL